MIALIGCAAVLLIAAWAAWTDMKRLGRCPSNPNPFIELEDDDQWQPNK